MGTTVAVCRKCKGQACLTEFLRDKTDAKVRRVGCQKVCKGPVVGLAVAGRMEWFAKVDGAKALVALAELAAHPGRAKVRKPLEKRRVVKRSGRLPR